MTPAELLTSAMANPQADFWQMTPAEYLKWAMRESMRLDPPPLGPAEPIAVPDDQRTAPCSKN